MTSAASAMTARGLSPWPATRAAPPRPPRGIAPVSSGGGGVPRALSRRAASGAASRDASPALPPRGTNALQEDADGAIMFTEHMYLVQEDSSLALKLKHFNADLTG